MTNKSFAWNQFKAVVKCQNESGGEENMQCPVIVSDMIVLIILLPQSYNG